jgi:hypothetical protein
MMTLNERSTTDIIRAVFDALPSVVFVVDGDVRIQEYNAAAAGLLTADGMTILKRRAGEVLHCLHSNDVPEGCGRGQFCEDCIIRNSVTKAFQGNRVVRLRTKMQLVRDGYKMKIYALVTASPFHFQERPLVLLVIEDISEITELQRIISICSVCRKVRDDEKTWLRVEAYFKNHWDVDFSHGLCPDCYKIELDKLEADIEAEQKAPTDD